MHIPRSKHRCLAASPAEPPSAQALPAYPTYLAVPANHGFTVMMQCTSLLNPPLTPQHEQCLHAPRTWPFLPIMASMMQCTSLMRLCRLTSARTTSSACKGRRSAVYWLRTSNLDLSKAQAGMMLEQKGRDAKVWQG